MATATTTAPITADEFLKMDLGDGLHELVRGEVVEVPSPEYEHGQTCANGVLVLHGFGRRTGHGHAASNDSVVAIGEYDVRGADISYYSEARWPRANVGKERPPVPPDLVVEALSASDRPSKVLQKVADYLDAGVGMVWVLSNRRRNLTIYRAGDPTPVVLGEAELLADLPELPGFSCRVAEFFD